MKLMETTPHYHLQTFKWIFPWQFLSSEFLYLKNLFTFRENRKHKEEDFQATKKVNYSICNVGNFSASHNATNKQKVTEENIQNKCNVICSNCNYSNR